MKTETLIILGVLGVLGWYLWQQQLQPSLAAQSRAADEYKLKSLIGSLPPQGGYKQPDKLGLVQGISTGASYGLIGGPIGAGIGAAGGAVASLFL